LCVYAAYVYNTSSTYTVSGQIYGTYWKITSTKYLDISTQQKVRSELNTIDLIASNYKDSSELSLINKAKVGESIKVSKTLNYLLEVSGLVHYQTSGLFNITLGIETSKMGFGPSLKEDIGSNNIRWINEAYTLDNQLITKHQQFHFDLSAIAKGYAVDQIAKLLIQEGYKNFVLDIGGELAVIGKKYDQPWTIAIQDPNNQGSNPIYIIEDETPIFIATSGEYRNYNYDRDGNKITHTIDPRTNSSIDPLGLSVSVKNNSSAMMADAYATALNIMDVNEGLEFANLNNIQVMYVTSDNILFSENWND
jgi:thiamine biosynthesis lipoprotein